MLKRSSAIVQTNYSKKELENRFGDIEEIIMRVHGMSDEYDRLMNTAEIEMEKLEVSQ